MAQAESADTSVRAVKRRRARQALLDKGLEMMGKRGIGVCKVEDITKAAGLGKGTFFTHFASKDEFIAELAGQVLNDLGRRVRPMGLAPTDAQDLVAGVGAVHLRYFQLRPQSASLLCQACGPNLGHTGRDTPLTRFLGEYLDMLGAMLSPACQAMGWPPERARELGLMVLGTSLGFFWLARPLGMGNDLPAELLDRLGRALARGMGG